MKKIVVASKNKGKLKELNTLLNNVNIEVISMEDAGFNDEIEETGTSLKENAFIKAKAIFDKVNIPTLADDSGLFVEALDGAPGVYSAIYAMREGFYKEDMNKDELNIACLLHNLQGNQNRNAYFECMLCFIDVGKDAVFLNGKVEGKIIDEKRGTGGFGYDPIFIPEGYSQTFGELDYDTKNLISHRYKALQELVKYFNQPS